MRFRAIFWLGTVMAATTILAPRALAAVPITDCAGLQGIDNDPSGSYMLTADIDCSGFTFTPIGITGNTFTGELNGNGHTISNLTINDGSPTGLFGYMEGAEVRNLRLSQIEADGYMMVGSLAGYSDGSVVTNVGVNAATISGDRDLGGLIGSANNTNISSSYTISSFIDGSRYLGGLVGNMNDGSLNNVYSRDSIIDGGFGDTIGGLVGQTNAGNGLTITNAYSNNSLSGMGYLGGIVGLMGSADTTCAVSNVFSAVDLFGAYDGAVVGYLSGVCSVTGSYYLTGNCVGDTGSSGPVSCAMAADVSDFYDADNPPLTSWNFATIWKEVAGLPEFLWTDQVFPDPPSDVSALVEQNDIHLTWTNPDDVDFASITIRRSTVDYPSSHTDGTAVADGLTGTSFTDTDLATGNYYYSLFAKTTGGDYSIPVGAEGVAGRNACLLQSYWKFDEAPAAPIDASGNGYHGTGTNIALSHEAPPAGFLNPYSFAFNGSNSKVQVTRPVANDFSICAWIRTTAQGAGTGTQHYLSRAIAHAEAGTILADFGMGMDANERLTFGVGGSSDYGVHGSTAINIGDWVHVCATRQKSDGAIKLYVNGAEDGAGTGSLVSLTANPVLTIGNGTDGAQPWDGLIDDVRVYPYALYPAEVADLADSVNACFGEAVIHSSSSSSEAAPQGGGGGRRGTAEYVAQAFSSLSSGFRSSARAAAPGMEAKPLLQQRVCDRVAKRFAADKTTLDRLNDRLIKRFGFRCEG